MWKKILILSFYLIICIIIYNKNIQTTNVETKIKKKSTIPPIQEEKPIGRLIIDKINLNEQFYSLESPKNNVEEHITILNHSEDPSKDNSIFFLAAHSGTGKIAYFDRLDEININDKVILEYKNNSYEYIVTSIWEQKKDGVISVPKENINQLILTTCSPNKKDMQLIINLSRK